VSGADAYRLTRRVRARLFTVVIRRSFAAWGSRSVAVPPFRPIGERAITVGARVCFGAGCWLNAIGGVIAIGDGCSFSGDCTISAAESVTIGREVLVARGVHIGDHDHAFADPSRPVAQQGVANVAPVTIGDGAWIGHGAAILAGVRVGAGAVIAAGAVVTRDVPAYSLAVGAPARVTKSWAPAVHASSVPGSRPDVPGRDRLAHPRAGGAQGLADADRLLKGEWETLNVIRTDMARPDWSLDQMTGRRSTPEAYALSLNQRDESAVGNSAGRRQPPR
jgi:acetyltransferase-like isoleucine patch superfamily enzyme